ncbi:MAG: hypothetical protein JF606_29820, partial [Burkholderiales bacterium]|nr:hypothetical protein [Burkholderiales bacterium]
HGGADAFSVLLAEELALQAAKLKSIQETNGIGPAQVEADAASICTALEERVATANGISVPELRQMLAILATNPQASAAQLREAAKGVIARSAQKALAEPRTDPAATQIPLPTAMLAAVRPPTSTAADDGASQAALLPGLPSIDNQGELPTELAVSDPRSHQAPAVADPQQAAQALLDALRDLAASTYNTDLFVVATRMPLGYFMEPPPSPLQPNPTSTLPEDQQIRLRRAGWQLLTTLSSQLDQRCCNERCLPEASRWLQAVRSNGMAEVLSRCGITVAQGRVQLDAECLFYILTEPRLLGPAVMQVLRALALAIRRGSSPNLLPPQLELITALRAMAA